MANETKSKSPTREQVSTNLIVDVNRRLRGKTWEDIAGRLRRLPAKGGSHQGAPCADHQDQKRARRHN